ncbi:MAG: riboflavin kinase [Candidatus Nanohaloarchaea archaeon]
MKGKVFSGEGKASKFLQIDEYSEFIQEEAGFEPFPGTLNLRGDPQEIKKLKSQTEKSRLEGFETDGREFGGLEIYFIEIEGLKACLIDPDLSRYGKDVVEVCSSSKLRSKLGIEDGDKVEITSSR